MALMQPSVSPWRGFRGKFQELLSLGRFVALA